MTHEIPTNVTVYSLEMYLTRFFWVRRTSMDRSWSKFVSYEMVGRDTNKTLTNKKILT